MIIYLRSCGLRSPLPLLWRIVSTQPVSDHARKSCIPAVQWIHLNVIDLGDSPARVFITRLAEDLHKEGAALLLCLKCYFAEEVELRGAIGKCSKKLIASPVEPVLVLSLK